MSTTPQLDPFSKAHLDGMKAVTTFLPSLSTPPQAPQLPQQPLPHSDLRDAVRAMSMVNHVEGMSKRMANGLPPEEPKPTPEEQFGNQLDAVHTRAISSAIAAHPETDRARLISEAHDSATKWIGSHNGKVVVHGKIELAHNAQSAQNLAAKIVNQTVEEHDAREQAKQEAAAHGLRAAGNQDKKSEPSSGSDRARTSGVSDGSANGGNTNADTGGRSPTQGTPEAVSDGADGTTGNQPPTVGGVDPATGRTITQPTTDLDQAQQLATAAAPELKKNLKSVARQVKGANVDGVRAKKQPDRAKQKVEEEHKPANTVSDLVAGRIAVDSPEAKEQTVAAIKGSMPVVDEDNKFQQGDPDYGFRSHTLQAGLSNGATAEVQVVPQEIADADEDTHETYERGRQAEIDGDTETAQQTMADNKDTHDQAMQEFNERNQPSEKPDIRKILEAAGIKVSGDPIKLGGHLFFGVQS